MKKFLKIISKIVSVPAKIICGIFALLLILSYFSIYINPQKLWFFAYLGLFFQVLFVANFLFLIFWAALKNKFFAIHLTALLPSLFFLGDFFRLFNAGDVILEGRQLKIMTYNVQMFNLNQKKNDSTYIKIANFINSEKPDIVCLQEFYVANGKLSQNQFASLVKGLNYHSVFYSVSKEKSKYGIATFSRYPIKMNLEIPFENSVNAAMYTDIDVNGQPIRIYNIHFQSIKLNLKKSFARILGEQDEARLGEIEDVSNRLRKAFIKRAVQVDDVAQHISVSPYPVIVCGDFNDTPVSYTYNQMKGNKKDSFCEAGTGLSSTYDSKIPSLRIDYVLHDKVINTLTYKVHKVKYSDHFPIVTSLDINKLRKNEENYNSN